MEFVEPTKFFYVYNYTDHLGNVRLSYTQNGNTVKTLEDNHYYPFGLKHENYASERFESIRQENGDLYVIQPTERREWQYKYNGKEWQDELGLNFYDYGARNYDAAIGRWMNVDPKAETSRRFSPYTYALDNPIYFIDPDGMEADDWIKFINKNGNAEIVYDSDVKSVADATAKKYSNVETVFKSGTYFRDNIESSEIIRFEADGTYFVNGGEKRDVDDTSYRTENGTYISENKGVMDATGDFLPGGLQQTGDAITLAAIPVAATGIGAPLAAGMAEFGGIMSATGAGLEQINDIAEGKFSLGKLITKGVIETASRKIGGADAFGPVEKIVNDNVFNLLDNTLDTARDKK